MHDRSAYACAKLVLIVFGLGESAAVGEEVVSVKEVVAKIFVGHSMNFVGTALAGDHYRGTRAAAILRGVRIGDDLELLDGIHGRTGCLGAEFLDVFRKRVVINSVEDKIVLERMNSVDVERAGATRARRAALVRVAVGLHTGHEAQEIIPVAQVKRSVGDRVVIDDRAQRSVLGGQVGRRVVHRHGLLGLANL